MAAIAMVSEDEATGKVAAIYADIKTTLGIDFVPNLYKVMAPKPDYLQANWMKVKGRAGQVGSPDQGDHCRCRLGG